MHDRTRAIAKNLHLNMSRPFNQFLEKQMPVTERSLGFACTTFEGELHLSGICHQPQTPTATAGRCLQHHWVAKLCRQQSGSCRISQHIGEVGVTLFDISITHIKTVIGNIHENPELLEATK